MESSYRKLLKTGELAKRAREAVARLSRCELCPRRCRVDRLADARGFCRVGRKAQVASFNPHFGEEEVLVGDGGSGTIFFAGCNLGCVFCQNWDISHVSRPEWEVGAEGLAAVMLELQAMGTVNINLVTPSHVVPQILEALVLAARQGLRLPLVYNSGGYDAPETLELLDGIVDVYMPDVKMADPDAAATYLLARDYPERAREAVLRMHAQVGDLVVDRDGLARRGLLVRHLVMPEGLAGTAAWMRFLAREVSPDTYVNIMDQYRPCGEAERHPAIARAVTREEYRRAMEFAREAGIRRFDQRGKAYFLRLLDHLALIDADAVRKDRERR
ncbi:MAG: radical SAM protein [Thermodesulfobacteriota bacterium]